MNKLYIISIFFLLSCNRYGIEKNNYSEKQLFFDFFNHEIIKILDSNQDIKKGCLHNIILSNKNAIDFYYFNFHSFLASKYLKNENVNFNKIKNWEIKDLNWIDKSILEQYNISLRSLKPGDSGVFFSPFFKINWKNKTFIIAYTIQEWSGRITYLKKYKWVDNKTFIELDTIDVVAVYF